MPSATSKAPKLSELGISIEFTERFFSDYARSRKKSVKTILLVVLKQKRMPFLKIERKQKFNNNILS